MIWGVGVHNEAIIITNEGNIFPLPAKYKIKQWKIDYFWVECPEKLVLLLEFITYCHDVK